MKVNSEIVAVADTVTIFLYRVLRETKIHFHTPLRLLFSSFYMEYKLKEILLKMLLSIFFISLFQAARYWRAKQPT